MFWGDTRKMRKTKAAARGTARKPMSLLSAAVAAALLAGVAVPAFAQSADAGGHASRASCGHAYPRLAQP